MYVEQEAQKLPHRQVASLPPFVFGNGYSLSAFDLGNSGVKLELYHNGDVGAAIILPSAQVQILERLSKAKIENSVLERGDKKRIKEALRALRT